MRYRAPFLWVVRFVWVATILAAGQVDAQLRWSLHQVEPVLTAGGSEWDAAAVGQPSCVV